MKPQPVNTFIRDSRIVHKNLITAIQLGHEHDAYAWVRLLCRRLRMLTVKQVDGPYDWMSA